MRKDLEDIFNALDDSIKHICEQKADACSAYTEQTRDLTERQKLACRAFIGDRMLERYKVYLEERDK